MGIRQWFNNPEEKRAFNEVERTWPDLANWADDATDARKNKAALDRMRTDAVLRRMYRAAAAKFFRFDRLILRAVPGMKLLAAGAVAEPVDLGSDSGWLTLEEEGNFLASRLVSQPSLMPPGLADVIAAAKMISPLEADSDKVRSLIVDIPLTARTVSADTNADQVNELIGMTGLEFTRSGRLEFVGKSGDHLRIPLRVEAGPWQIFLASVGPATVKFTWGEGMRPVAPAVFPQWWGARPGADGAVNSAAFNAALGCFHEEGLVRVPVGQYAIGDTIQQTNPCAALVGVLKTGTSLAMSSTQKSAVEAQGRIQNLIVTGLHKRPIDAPSFQSGQRTIAGVHFCGGGLKIAGAGVNLQDVQVSGFPVGVYARPHALNNDANFFMHNAWLRDVRLSDVTWGFVMDTGGNQPSLYSVRVSDANVGVLFPLVRFPGGHPLNAPQSCIDIRRGAFDHVPQAILADQVIVAPLVDGCSFEVVDTVGVQLVPDGLGVCPGLVGPCLFESCAVPVMATTGTGTEPLPWLSVAVPGGTGPQAPSAGSWDVGDRVDNDAPSPAEGSPAGWVCQDKT